MPSCFYIKIGYVQLTGDEFGQVELSGLAEDLVFFAKLNNFANRGSNTRQTGPRNLGQVVKVVFPDTFLFYSWLRCICVELFTIVRCFPVSRVMKFFRVVLAARSSPHQSTGSCERNAHQSLSVMPMEPHGQARRK
jgi:hypothetical protein